MAICMYITQLRRPLAAAFINQGNSTSGTGLKSNANQLLPTAGCDENSSKKVIMQPVSPCATKSNTSYCQWYFLRPISAALMAMVRARSMPNAHIGVTGKFFSAKTGCSGSRVRDGAARWRTLPSVPFIVASLTKRSAYIGANCCLLMSAGWSASAPSSKSCPNLFHGLGSENSCTMSRSDLLASAFGHTTCPSTDCSITRSARVTQLS